MSDPIERPRRMVLFHLAFLLVLCAVLFFYRLAARDLWSSHEARAAQDAQTILEDGCWGLPRLYDGRLELQKPPLYYWLVAATAKLRGTPVDALAVRLPAAVSGLLCVVLVYLLCLQRRRPIAGLVAAAVLATAVHFTWLARVGRIDMPLTFTMTLALAGYYLGRDAAEEDRGRAAFCWLLIAYVAAAAGILLKGPIGLVLPAAVVGVDLLLRRAVPFPWHARSGIGLVHRLGLWWGLPLMAAIVLPWFWWANAETEGELFRVFFWHHNVERGFGGSDVLRGHPWWFYLAHLASDLLPWSLALPVTVWLWLRRGWWRLDLDARLGLVWLLTVTALLSCFRFKRSDYLLPAYPGAALFLGWVAEHCYRASASPRRFALGFGAVLLACAAGWLGYVGYVLPRDEALREYRRFAAEVREWAPAPQRVVFFRTETHALSFHVGRPLDRLVQWRDLDEMLARSETAFVVMPPESAAEWPQFLRSAYLEEVRRNTDLSGGRHEKPLVLLRARPVPPSPTP